MNDEVVHNYTPIQWERNSLISLAFSGLVGSLFGVMIAMAVNTALVELSTSSAFSLYFGLLFVLVGFIIVWRIAVGYRGRHPEDSEAAGVPRKYLVVFGGLVGKKREIVVVAVRVGRALTIMVG